MNEPLVSVIIPVYNVFPYLRESLDSVVNQTYSNLEILIIDDGSDDGSETICDEYGRMGDSRIQVIHQTNQGLSAARNTGLDRMSGDLIAFLDPDDSFYPDMIRLMTEVLLISGADIAVCGFVRYRSRNNRVIRQQKRYPYDEEGILTGPQTLNGLITGKISYCVWNKLYKREIWEDLRFPYGHVYEDVWTMYLAIEKARAVRIVNQILVRHRKRPGSITATRSFRNGMDNIRATRLLEAFVNEHTPEIFSEKNRAYFEDKTLRKLAMRCAGWMVRPTKENQSVRKELRAEVLARGKEMNGHFVTTKTRIVFSLFKYCPYMLPFVQKCNRVYKRLTAKSV